MTLTQILQVLVDADQGKRRAADAKGRYSVLMYLPSELAAQVGSKVGDSSEDDPDDAEDDEEDDAEGSMVLTELGQADSLLGAPDLLGRTLCRLVPEAEREEALPSPAATVTWFDEDISDERDLSAFNAALHTRERRAVLAYAAGYLAGPFYAVGPAAASKDVYLSEAQRCYIGARFVFGMGAAPPNQEQGRRWAGPPRRRVHRGRDALADPAANGRSGR